MTDAAKPKGNKGKYTATPVTVSFPADCANADLAGKTVTYKGRGRHPRWYEFAIQLGLIASDTEDSDAQTDTEATDTASDSAKA